MEAVKPGTTIDVDEINEFTDARYISGIEAVWHTLHFSMYGQDPPVMVLDCHLENQNTVLFDDKDHVNTVLEKGT